MMFLVKEICPSNKWRSCPSRAQLEFFERSVTHFQRNGVIERSVTHFQRNGVIERSVTYFQNMV